MQTILIIRNEGIVAIHSKADVAMVMGKLGTGPAVTKAVCNGLFMQIAEVKQIACGAHLKIGDNIDVLVQEVLIGKDKLIAALTPCNGIGAQTGCNLIVTIAGIDHITALTPCNGIGAQTGCNRIVTITGSDRIVTFTACDGIVAFTRIDAVIARSAINSVIFRSAIDGVIA